MLHRPLLLAEDRRAGGEELHLSRLRQVLQVLLGEVVEGSVAPQELDYVVHRGAGGSLPDALVTRQRGPRPRRVPMASGDRRVRASPPRSSSTPPLPDTQRRSHESTVRESRSESRRSRRAPRTQPRSRRRSPPEGWRWSPKQAAA